MLSPIKLIGTEKRSNKKTKRAKMEINMIKNKLQQYKILLILLILVAVSLIIFLNQIIYAWLIVEIFAFLLCSYLVIFDQREATSKIAWILALLFLPIVGIMLYYLIGREPRLRKLSKQQLENERNIQETVSKILQEHSEIIHAKHDLSKEIFHLSAKYPTKDNQLTLLKEGTDAFASLVQDIKQATHHVHVFFYIIKGDETGEELIAALIEKARQGIKVRFMYDSVGSIAFPNRLLDTMRENGVEVRTYDLLNSPWLSNKANWRNHRKIVVIDGEIAHTGGMNIGNEYSGRGKKFSYWRDTNVRIEGPSVLELQECFVYDWLFLDEGTETITYFINQQELYFPLQTEQPKGSEIVQVVYGGPYDQERIIKDSFNDLIGKAVDSIKIAMPYFIPDEETLGALRRAARCGINVQLIIPGKGDRGISFHGTNSFIDDLLSAGVEVSIYDTTAFIHCKYMIVDDVVATIGSTNFDIRSFYLNHELSMFIYGPSKTIDELNVHFTEDLAHAEKVKKDEWQRRSAWTKIKEKISGLFVPIL